ncbi:MAG: hypothetical protein II139_01965, partial [Lachnospiraceae bacterium]|nr:hypothetical protein [Lachnospiraceae bacterium]
MQQVRPIYKKSRERKEYNPALVVILSVAGVLLLCYLAITVYFSGRFRPGTWVGDYYATGVTPEELDRWLKAVTPVPVISVKDGDGNVTKVVLSDIRYEYSYREDLDLHLAKQIPFFWIAGLFEESRFEPECTLEPNEEDLRKVWEEIPAVRASAGQDSAYRIEYSREGGYILLNL